MSNSDQNNSDSQVDKLDSRSDVLAPAAEIQNALASRRIPVAVIILLTLASGIVHGMLDGRWSRPDDLIAQASQLDNLPDKCGQWLLSERQELDESAAELLRCYGSQVRVYQHEQTDSTVTVAVLFGPRGPIAVHTPEICYSSVAKKQVGERRVKKITHSGSVDEFWSVKFAENPSPDPSLDVWYGWSDGGSWVASENPRFWMTDNLYKLQIAGPIGDSKFRPCDDFLSEFLPQLQALIQ